MEEKTYGQELLEKYKYEPKSAWCKKDGNFTKDVYSYCEGYKEILNIAKTEREYVKETLKQAKQKGFKDIDNIYKEKGRLEPGDKVYKVIREKAIVLSVIGNNLVENGINMIGAHVDAPRIDIKQNPIYENTDMVFMKTHYYGGIKKYQWVTIPLAIHGVVCTKDMKKVEIVIGEKEDDPVFTITDLLPHLASEQMQKKMSEAITGEGLNLLIGSLPYEDEKVKEKAKLTILELLNETYGITESDFLSAELEIVPAFKARDVGLDRSMIGSYGQDDRVCSYTAMTAIFDIDDPEVTAMTILTDKEEIGSMGNTGANASYIKNFVARLCAYTSDSYNDIQTRLCLENSRMLSADVSAASDPNYEGTHDKLNSAYIGKGLSVMKYSGSRGKAGASDANAEFVAKVRSIFDKNNIDWHTTELGKVDKGGGGTIAYYIANLGVDVLDCGVPLLCMHSPFEIAGKVDVYSAYLGYKAFFNEMK